MNSSAILSFAVERGRTKLSAPVAVATAAAVVVVVIVAAVAARTAAAAAGQPAAAPFDAPAGQIEAYRAQRPKTVVELQPFRRSTTVAVEGPGGRRGDATLIEVNPAVNRWFLLALDWGERGGRVIHHLENPDPAGQTVALSDTDSKAIRLSAGGRTAGCDLWATAPASALEQAVRSRLAYAPLCDGRLYLRNAVKGRATSLEKTTDFLRDHVLGAEKIIGFVRREFYRDAFIEKAIEGTVAVPAPVAQSQPDAPRPASLATVHAERTVVPENLGIELAGTPGSLALGRWYAVRGAPGVFLSTIQPEAIAAGILAGDRGLVNSLDAIEAQALAYLVAFDLTSFELGFALGTDHPRIGWADRVRADVLDPALPGPDGIGSIAPLVANGMVAPDLTARTAATFTGGFKRQHGAFHDGALAQRNLGSHYGFVEQGAILGKLVPGLATLFVLNDGSVGMKTWTIEDDALLPKIRHARQNGVPLIEYDAGRASSAPGPLVARWAAGNWSGSDKGNLRSLRAGACVQESGNRRFLVYGYFSSATPSAMARAFQAYGCRYAMHLDMNALEHTYLALYVRKGSDVLVEHLVQGMSVLDRKAGGRLAPRFLAFPDDRDFFYLVRRQSSP